MRLSQLFEIDDITPPSVLGRVIGQLFAEYAQIAYAFVPSEHATTVANTEIEFAIDLDSLGGPRLGLYVPDMFPFAKPKIAVKPLVKKYQLDRFTWDVDFEHHKFDGQYELAFWSDDNELPSLNIADLEKGFLSKAPPEIAKLTRFT